MGGIPWDSDSMVKSYKSMVRICVDGLQLDKMYTSRHQKEFQGIAARSLKALEHRTGPELAELRQKRSSKPNAHLSRETYQKALATDLRSGLVLIRLAGSAWATGLTEGPGRVGQVIASWTVVAGAVRSWEMCVPQLLAFLALRTRRQEAIGLCLLNIDLWVPHPPAHLKTRQNAFDSLLTGMKRWSRSSSNTDDSATLLQLQPPENKTPEMNQHRNRDKDEEEEPAHVDSFNVPPKQLHHPHKFLILTDSHLPLDKLERRALLEGERLLLSIVDQPHGLGRAGALCRPQCDTLHSTRLLSVFERERERERERLSRTQTSSKRRTDSFLPSLFLSTVAAYSLLTPSSAAADARSLFSLSPSLPPPPAVLNTPPDPSQLTYTVSSHRVSTSGLFEPYKAFRDFKIAQLYGQEVGCVWTGSSCEELETAVCPAQLRVKSQTQLTMQSSAGKRHALYSGASMSEEISCCMCTQYSNNTDTWTRDALPDKGVCLKRKEDNGLKETLKQSAHTGKKLESSASRRLSHERHTPSTPFQHGVKNVHTPFINGENLSLLITDSTVSFTLAPAVLGDSTQTRPLLLGAYIKLHKELHSSAAVSLKSNESFPPSRPMPEFFMPPKGRFKSLTSQQLVQTSPACSFLATLCTRPTSLDHTVADNP
ncbi:hypothetical protein DNTS_009119 [Danionella cerebrum]|uniref:Uncharacterized protein n=1 Tax=Danionella cerebrum TaxID=2873325 RepID=A0A553QAQ0_9TELE|nr:hypothetical protein DNTS_009119 [Danionella translucida]